MSPLAEWINRLLGRRDAQSRQAPEVHATASTRLPVGTDFGPLATAQYVHDLRNLLNVISVCAESMAEQLPSGKTEWECAELRRATERASMLTRELLLAARPGPAGRGRVDLNHVITSVADVIARLAGERVRLTLRLSQEPAMIVADASELERILLNLTLNARDAMTGGGVLSIETAVLSASAASPPVDPGTEVPLVRFRLSDSGHGMRPEVQARMFEPFFTTKPAGTGLGLASVAFTVQQLKGTIRVESHAGVGTRVTIQLPLAGTPVWPFTGLSPLRSA